MGTTINETISSSGCATVGPFNAVAFLTINNLGPDPGPPDCFVGRSRAAGFHIGFRLGYRRPDRE
jgi:hypothetical protein